MDLHEMAEEHKRHKVIYTVTPEGVDYDSFAVTEKTKAEPDNRFNCDKMNKAFEDIFGGGE